MDNFSKAIVRGVHCSIPSKRIDNSYFEKSFEKKSIDDVVKIIGVKTRYWAGDQTSTGDLCANSAKALMANLNWSPESIDALIFITQTPDFFLPPTSSVIHKKLNLHRECKAFDVNLGCSGYTYGLWLATCFIEASSARRVLVLAGDTNSKMIDKSDRTTCLVFGDAGSATAVEYSEHSVDSHYVLGTDGVGFNHLIVPQGAFGNYDIQADSRFKDKDPSCIFMDGAEVFNFTLGTVPKLLISLLAKAQSTIDDVDFALMHQANLFMLNHLQKKAKIPNDKFLVNIDKYGNTSSCSIPLLMCSEMTSLTSTKDLKLVLLGYGVGWSWGGAFIHLRQNTYFGLETSD